MINENMFRLKKNGELYSRCFCRNPELIENYDLAIADTTQTWDCHHRLESCFTQKFLKEMNLYYGVEPEALIFLTPAEHHKLDSACKRQSEANKGKTPWNKGKQTPEETKRKLRESNSKKVLCIETGEVFVSIRDASRKTGIGNIDKACNGKYKTAGGYHWAFI